MPQLTPFCLRSRWPIVAGVVLLLIWLRVAFSDGFSQFSLSEHPLPPSGNPADAFDKAPIKSSAISKVCSKTKWNQDLVFTCDNSFGGVGNVRNSVLTCVRYSIAAGAALVVPKILLRNDKDISKLTGNFAADLSHMFDKPFFIESLRLSCPSLQVYESDAAIPKSKAWETLSLLPESIIEGKIPLEGIPNPERWPAIFQGWLHMNKKESSTPTIVALGRSYLHYPIHSDGEAFASQFGSIIRMRPDVRQLATSTLKKMAQGYDFVLDYSSPILPRSFYGVHLRTEQDAVRAWATVWKYGQYGPQSRHYLSQAPRSNTSVIYVASGDANEVAKFTRDAEKINMAVTTKLALLDGVEKDQLLSLAWDQQALVDFLVLSKGSDFAGIGHSSFAWNLALQRRAYAKSKRQVQLSDWKDGDALLVNGTGKHVKISHVQVTLFVFITSHLNRSKFTQRLTSHVCSAIR